MTHPVYSRENIRWRPYCAILPNGIVFPLDALSGTSVDDDPFSVLFGAASIAVSKPIRTQILAAYMAAASDTTRAINLAARR